MMTHVPTVCIVDDDKAVRDSLQWLVESVGLKAKTYESAQRFLEEVGQEDCGCAVVDIRLPGMSGLDLQDRLNERGLEIPTLIITGHADVPVAVRAMKAGAVDFIEKPFSNQMLLDRIRDALEQDDVHRAEAAEVEEVEKRLARLTPREYEVMQLVVQGRLNKQIAGDLGLSHKTIEVHRAHVMEKMEAETLAELVRMAVAVENAGREEGRAARPTRV
jgi:FixJ family two-component response regulator